MVLRNQNDQSSSLRLQQLVVANNLNPNLRQQRFLRKQQQSQSTTAAITTVTTTTKSGVRTTQKLFTNRSGFEIFFCYYKLFIYDKFSLNFLKKYLLL